MAHRRQITYVLRAAERVTGNTGVTLGAYVPVMKGADKAITTSGLVAMASTAGLVAVRGYGTVLFQIVVLGAWSIVANLTSGSFADQHKGIVWIVALLLNALGFAIVGVPLWLITRNRFPRSGPVLILCWTALYLAMLFVLFPATDGP